MDPPELERVRRIALALPGVTERRSHGAPCFFVRERRPLCYVHDHHAGDDRVTLWCPVADGVAEGLSSTEPRRFFRPTPSASGVFATWLGVFLDAFPGDEDWSEIEAILEGAYRSVAPRALVAELDAR